MWGRFSLAAAVLATALSVTWHTVFYPECTKAFSDNEVVTVLGLGLRVVRAQIVELPRFGAVGFGAYGFGVYLWVQRFHHLGL